MFSMTDENWRRQYKSLPSRLKLILHQGLFTDVTFDIQGREFKCHRLILALGSPYFERTFYHTFDARRAPDPVVISDVSPRGFQCVLNFLYTDQVTFGDDKQAFETYEAAGKFGMPDLQSECEIYLSEVDFRPWTVWKMLEEANRLAITKLQKKCLKYVENNTLDCLRDKTFLSSTDEIALTVVKSDRLAAPEIEVLLALIARTKVRSGSSSHLLRLYLGAYLRHVRFRAMEPKEFCNLIKQHPDIIDKDDCLLILQHLELPSKNPLPSWCSKLPRRIWP